VITLNVIIVKFARKVHFRRSRSRQAVPWDLPDR
jgi:hypothetical protein